MSIQIFRPDQITALHRDLCRNGYINSAQPLAFSLRHRLDGMLIVAGTDASATRDVDFATANNKSDNSPESAWHAAIYQCHPDIDTIIHSQAACTRTVSKMARALPPLLDDFAQIIGPSARLIDPPAANKARVMGRALRRRSAVLIKGLGALCIGRNIEDTFAAVYVCEKNAKALIEASFLGGGKRINIFESYMMHHYYQYKYSQQIKINR